MSYDYRSRTLHRQEAEWVFVAAHVSRVIVKVLSYSIAIFAVGIAVLAAPAFSQQASTAAGDYSGMLGPLHVKLHLVSASNGSLSGTIDSPDQGMFGVPCADVHLNGQALSFTVPMAHAAWMGFVSSDGNSMSGTYNLGTPVPLNWTRVPAANLTNPPASASPAAPAPAPTTISSSEPTCPATSMGNYWDGSTWKPLTTVVPLPRERGLSIREQLKNPLNPMAPYTTIYRYKDTSAALTLGPSPRFCFVVSVNAAPNVVIGELDVKKNDREIEMKFSDRQNSSSGIPARKSVEVDVKRTSPTSIEATPKSPLHPGQYVINSSYMAFDFGVQ
jgi:hypothetical protein